MKGSTVLVENTSSDKTSKLCDSKKGYFQSAFDMYARYDTLNNIFPIGQKDSPNRLKKGQKWSSEEYRFVYMLYRAQHLIDQSALFLKRLLPSINPSMLLNF
jgi:hypothetical protein